MWVILALASALCLGFYDIFKKLSVRGNDVLMVLLLNTCFGALYMSPFIIAGIADGSFGFGNSLQGHLQILLKSAIVLGSWILGYFAIKHLPLTVQGANQRVASGDSTGGRAADFRREAQPDPVGGHHTRFCIAVHDLSHRCQRGFLDQALTLDMDVDRSDMPWCRQRALRQIPAEIIRPDRGSVVVFAIPVHHHDSDDLHNTHASPKRRPVRMALDDTLHRPVSDSSRHGILLLAVATGSIVAVVSMIRRGSVLRSFIYGVAALHEKNIRPKAHRSLNSPRQPRPPRHRLAPIDNSNKVYSRQTSAQVQETHFLPALQHPWISRIMGKPE